MDLIRPFGNLNELRNAIGEETAAILVEPIQGEGGIARPTSSILRDCADSRRVRVVADLRRSADRNGHWQTLGVQWADVTPDVMAAPRPRWRHADWRDMATAEAAQGMTPGTRSTYGGNYRRQRRRSPFWKKSRATDSDRVSDVANICASRRKRWSRNIPPSFRKSVAKADADLSVR